MIKAMFLFILATQLKSQPVMKFIPYTLVEPKLVITFFFNKTPEPNGDISNLVLGF